MTRDLETIIIRPATTRDLSSIVEIYQESFSRRQGPATFSRDLKEIMLNSPYSMLYFVAEADNKIRGFISAYPLGDVMDIYDLTVRLEDRRQGIGRQLMERILLESKARDIDLLMLEVAESNLPALKLYEKLGFICYGLREKYYQDTGEDAYLMRLDLI
ncbi:MAG TPA: ribosomal protein S18-alanine N-acetyltransferase [Clostridiaceae bacterium]|nr:ribosomal protein S18-alanine N-acetyltransferase [Clostridiaceae bacterium]